MYYCHNCGKAMDENNLYCADCASVLSNAPINSTDSKSNIQDVMNNGFQKPVYQKKFVDASFTSICEWIESNDIEILDINANMQYGKRNILSSKEWYFQFFIVNFVEKPGAQKYACLYDYGTEGSILKSKNRVIAGMTSFLDGKRIVFDMLRDEYMSNGEGNKTFGRFVIFQEDRG